MANFPPVSTSILAAAVTSASNQAALAAASLVTIKNAYYGALAAAPTVRPDGSARQVGDRYYNTATGAENTWNGSAWYVPNIDSAALANASDTTKGAALVGDKGTTISKALEIDKRKPRKLFSKLFASASGIAQIKHLQLGDSLSNRKMDQILASLDRRMGGANKLGVNTAGSSQASGGGSCGVDCSPSSIVSATSESAQYQYWPTGNVLRIDSGGSVVWTTFGVSPTFTNIDVYYIKEPSAGTLNLSVGGSVIASASANSASALGVLSYTQTLSQLVVSTAVTGAPVRILFVHVKSSTSSGVDQYLSMAVGGLALSSATASSQGLAIWQAAIFNILPDFVTIEFDDEFGTDAPTQIALATFGAMLDAACPLADKLLIGSTPRLVNDAGKLASSNYLRGFAGSRGASWLFFDSYYLLGSYTDMGAIFGSDDGTHPSAGAESFAAEVMWESLGLNGFNLGYVSRAVNDPGTASNLARNTKFSGGNDNVSIETDASFGYDWQIKFPRVLSFNTRGAYGTPNSPIWQFSGNAAVAPNVMPLNIDFNTSGNVRKLTTDSSSGTEFTVFKKTDNVDGRMNMLVGLIRGGYTRAQLLAMPANALKGSLAWCVDCTGEAQWVYARGNGATDWATVDGKTAI